MKADQPLQVLHVRTTGQAVARVEDSPGVPDDEVPVKGIVISHDDYHVGCPQLFGAQFGAGDG